MTAVKKITLAHWGLYVFWLSAIVGIVILMQRGASAHYEIFTIASKKLWAGENPYLYEHTSGFFNYSPSCGLFFYGLFAFFPDSIGLLLYITSSLILVWMGFSALFKLFPLVRLKNIFFVLISSELMGAILNARIEIITLGGWCLFSAWIIQNKHKYWAYFGLAALLNFKIQTAALLGLFFVWELNNLSNWKEKIKLFSMIILFIAFWFLLPLTFVSWKDLQIYHEGMQSNVTNYINGAWLGFQQIFSFFHRVFKIEVSWIFAQTVTATIAVFFAIIVYLKSKTSTQSRLMDSALLAMALAAGFTVTLSPMSQSAAYILYAPLLLFSLRIWENEKRKNSKIIIALWIFCAYYLTSLSYSDATPKNLRYWLFEHAIKPLGPTLLIILVIWKTKIVNSNEAKAPIAT